MGFLTTTGSGRGIATTTTTTTAPIPTSVVVLRSLDSHEVRPDRIIKHSLSLHNVRVNGRRFRIRLGWERRNAERYTLCTVLTVLVLVAFPARAQEDCTRYLRYLRERTDARNESGTGDWDALLSLIAQGHRCFGTARTEAHAKLFDFETFVLVQQRRFVEADSIFDRFFSDFEAVAARDVVARMHVRRGYIYDRLAQTAESLDEYAQAVAMIDQLPPEEAGNALDDAGTNYRGVGDLYTAQRYLSAADSIFSTLYVENSSEYGPRLGRVRMRRAAIFLDDAERGGRSHQEAAALAAPLLADAKRLLPATPEWAFIRIQTLLWAARAHVFEGESYQASVETAEALRLSPWLEETAPQMVTWAWRVEGWTRKVRGDYETARAAYARALDLARASGEQEEEMRAEIGLGEVAEAIATDDESLRVAEQHFRRATMLAEAQRSSFGTHDWSASAWETAQEPYRHLTRILLKQGRAADAFVALDATRARYLRDLRALARLREELDEGARYRLDSLNARLRAVRYELGNEEPGLARRSLLNQQAFELQQAIQSLAGFSNPDAYSLDLSALHRRLEHEHQVLLSYFFDEDAAYVFVVRADTLAAVQLPTSEADIRAELAEASSLWHPEEPQDGTGVSFNLRPFSHLYEQLFAPIRDFIPEDAALVVIPQGALTLFPFGLLLEAEHPPYDYATAPYLFRHFRVTTELAAGLLLEGPLPFEPTLSMLALGRSRFGGLRPAAFRDRAAPRLPDLPAVEEEVHLIHRQIGGLEALNEAATEPFLYEHLGQARLLHLASHAFVDPVLPLYSRVVLWGTPEGEDDGTLYLYELQGRPMAPELVVLSGCSTARGLNRVGEGMMGLQYAFRAAGAPGVLATLWQVDDQATVDLMEQFYVHLRRGLPKDEALREAQLDYLRKHEGRAASPFFWAAPVLYGNVSPVHLEPRAPSALIWIPVGIALLLLGLMLPRLVQRLRHG